MNDGKGVVAHSHLGQAELPARLLPAPQAVNTIDMAAVRTARAGARAQGLRAGQGHGRPGREDDPRDQRR
jgi:hypothetical protein